MAKKKGARQGNNSNNNNSSNNNKNNNNNNNNNQRRWCDYCKLKNHNTANCSLKSGNFANTNGGKPFTTYIKPVEEEAKFKFCKFCNELGHDLAGCSAFPKELRAVGIHIVHNPAVSLIPGAPRFDNSSKIKKDYTNPFAGDKVQPNPFSELECTHSSQCRGLCGNKNYMAKSRELKRQLEETIGNMQLWLDTLTPPEEDPFSMDWEAVPTFEIPPVRAPHIDPMRLWNPNQRATQNVQAPLFPVPQPPKGPVVSNIDKFLRPDMATRPRAPFFRTGVQPMQLDPTLGDPVGLPVAVPAAAATAAPTTTSANAPTVRFAETVTVIGNGGSAPEDGNDL